MEAGEAKPGTKYDRLIAAAKAIPAAATIVVHPCDESSLRGVADAAEAGIIKPTLVGPSAKIKAAAFKHNIEISGFELVDAAHSEAAAAKAVELIHAAKGEMLMKGSLHTDELMRSVTAKAGGLRTERRISHVFVMDVPAYSETIFVTDAAINIFPDLDGKRDIVQNAIDLYTQAGFGTLPRVAILSAVETVTSKIPSTIEAAALCKMADRGQITGGATRWAAGVRQRHRPGSGEDQGNQVGGRRTGPDPCGAGSRGRQHAGQEPGVLRQGGWRRNRAGRPRSDRVDVAGRFAEGAHGILRGCDALCRRPAAPRPDGGRDRHGHHPRRQCWLLKRQVPGVRARMATAGCDREIKGQMDGIGSRPRLARHGSSGRYTGGPGLSDRERAGRSGGTDARERLAAG